MESPTAQARVDRIEAFEAELATLTDDGVLALTDAQRNAVTAHHAHLRATLRADHDVDRDRADRRLSLGLRVASFIGALSFGGGVYLFLDRYIDTWPRALATLVLIVLPIACAALARTLLQREPSGYLARLAALVSLSAFAYDLGGLAALYDIAPSDRIFLVLAVYALLLAYPVRSALLVAFAVLSFDAWVAMRAGTFLGGYWLDFGERPEHFIPAALVVCAIPLCIDHRRWPGFAQTYRVFGLMTLLLPILVLASVGELSYWPFSRHTIEIGYQLAGFGLSAGVIALGARRDWDDVVRTGVTFFVIFLYTKFYNWWWDALPAWAFFVIIGVTAVAAIAVLRLARQRRQGQEGAL